MNFSENNKQIIISCEIKRKICGLAPMTATYFFEILIMFYIPSYKSKSINIFVILFKSQSTENFNGTFPSRHFIDTKTKRNWKKNYVTYKKNVLPK